MKQFLRGATIALVLTAMIRILFMHDYNSAIAWGILAVVMSIFSLQSKE